MSKDVYLESFDCYHTPMLYSQYFSWPDPPTTTAGSQASEADKAPGKVHPSWSRINMGFIQKLLKALLINISDKAAVSITIMITCFISILDTATDIGIAYMLFTSGDMLL